MTLFKSWRTASLAIVGLSLVLSGCVDEDTVYNDRPFGDDPPASAGGFLGYVQGQAGEPTCAQCHATPSSSWTATAHAGAWEFVSGAQGGVPADKDARLEPYVKMLRIQ